MLFQRFSEANSDIAILGRDCQIGTDSRGNLVARTSQMKYRQNAHTHTRAHMFPPFVTFNCVIRPRLARIRGPPIRRVHVSSRYRDPRYSVTRRHTEFFRRQLYPSLSTCRSRKSDHGNVRGESRGIKSTRVRFNCAVRRVCVFTSTGVIFDTQIF